MSALTSRNVRLFSIGISARFAPSSIATRSGSPYRYNPLHNDLDAYALAYGIATLMTNLYGRGKEPFWQQASTNLVKFVILLHQVLDDYVTLFQVYEHVINPDPGRGDALQRRQSACRDRSARAPVSTDGVVCGVAPERV
jgi:hypothetical protein